MKVGSYIYTNSYAPADTNQLWVKPMSNGQAILYIFVDGKWTPTGGVGESAYEAAVKAGFNGSKEEWLDSLALKYSDLTAEQKADLVKDAVSAAERAAQAVENIENTINDIDVSSTDGAITALAAKQGTLENKVDVLGPKIEQVENELLESSSTAVALTPSSSHSGYRIGWSGDGRVLVSDSSRIVYHYFVGANKKFRIKGSCSILATLYTLDTSLASGYSKQMDINNQQNYVIYGETTTERQYVSVCNDKDASCELAIFTPLVDTINANTTAINNLRSQTRIERAAELQSTYSGYRIGAASSGRYMELSSTTNVYIYLVEANKKFRVYGKCSVAATAATLEGGVNGEPLTKLGDVPQGGNYDVEYQTTATQPYVAITVDASATEYGCMIVDGVADAVAKVAEKTKDVRTIITIKTTDSEVQILDKLISAYNTGNVDVYWEHGTYTFASVYQYMIETLEWSWLMELPIGNNCRYYFNNSTIISNPPEGEYSESRNIFGCKAGYSNKMDYEMYDGILINNGGTYCVHDECGRGSSAYVHKYVNMQMYYHNGETTSSVSKCIGGGCGINGYVVIENCIFVSDRGNNFAAVSWHGHQSDTNGITFHLQMDSCYVVPKLVVSTYFKAADTLFLKYSNNCHAVAPSLDENLTNVVSFNNSVVS